MSVAKPKNKTTGNSKTSLQSKATRTQTQRQKSPVHARREKVPKSSPKFAEGLCFQKLFFIFLIASVVGTIYEDLLYYMQTLLATGSGSWMIHRGVIYGPFNVIYGFGAVVMCWLLLRRKYSDVQIFFLAAFLGGVVEYVVSYLQEIFTGATSWDYSHNILNINGRTTIPIMLVWGVLGLLLVKFVYPFVSGLIERIPIKTGEILFITLSVLMCFNMLISWSAILRRGLRHNNIPAFSPVGKFLDFAYPDSYLDKYFPNMQWSQGDKK